MTRVTSQQEQSTSEPSNAVVMRARAPQRRPSPHSRSTVHESPSPAPRRDVTNDVYEALWEEREESDYMRPVGAVERMREARLTQIVQSAPEPAQNSRPGGDHSNQPKNSTRNKSLIKRFFSTKRPSKSPRRRTTVIVTASDVSHAVDQSENAQEENELNEIVNANLALYDVPRAAGRTQAAAGPGGGGDVCSQRSNTHENIPTPAVTPASNATTSRDNTISNAHPTSHNHTQHATTTTTTTTIATTSETTTTTSTDTATNCVHLPNGNVSLDENRNYSS